MGYNPKFSAFPRPPDPPGQSSEALNRLVNEARKLCDEMIPVAESKSVWITGSISREEIQKSYLTAGEMRKQMGLPDPYRMVSAIPPNDNQYNTELLYHPGTYTQDIITGTFFVPTPVPKATPFTITPKPPDSIITGKMTSEERRIKTEEFYNNAHGRQDRWSEWRLLWRMLSNWWRSDFGPQPELPETSQKQETPGDDGSPGTQLPLFK